MLETRNKRIGEIEYQVTQLPAPVGRRLLVKLSKIIGPTIGAALANLPEAGDEVSIGSLETGSIGEAITTFVDALSEDDLEHVCSVFSEHTQYSREAGKWFHLKEDDQFHWSGRYLDMFTWIIFCLEVNYSSFLSGSLALKGSLFKESKTKEPESESPNSSTGKSIESHHQNTIQ